jgi:Leucine-rich repeat (LRR) protein
MLFRLQLLLATIFFTIREQSAFILSDQCPAPAPCSCQGNTDYAIIGCHYQKLTTIPQFTTASIQVTKLVISLFGNSLQSLPRDAFKMLASFNASIVELQLYYNNINFIDDNAFDGINNTVTILQLQYNALTTLPTAIGKLRALEYLDVTNNSIISLNPSVLQGIAQSLKTLHLDLSYFRVWPDALSSLHALSLLHIYNLNLKFLNASAFFGFHNFLTDLTISQTSIVDQVSTAACQLPNLNYFRLHGFDMPKQGVSILNNCFAIRNVFSLEMINNLTQFPSDIFKAFPYLTDLRLGQNLLEYIESEYIPASNVLSRLDLNTNRFKRIPAAVNSMANLTYLDMRINLIVSIEAGDLDGAVNLQTLNLRDNPLRYISSAAFMKNSRLSQIDLQYTYLTTVHSLTSLDMTKTKVDCSCQMSYLKGWNLINVATFRGQCVNLGVDLRYYIQGSLQGCPA